MITKMIRGKIVEKYKIRDKYYHIIVDGTGLATSRKRYNEQLKNNEIQKFIKYNYKGIRYRGMNINYIEFKNGKVILNMEYEGTDVDIDIEGTYVENGDSISITIEAEGEKGTFEGKVSNNGNTFILDG